MSRMNMQTKLVYALEHLAHLHDLLEEEDLLEKIAFIESELERQLANEIHRKNSKLGKRIQEDGPRTTIKEAIGVIGRIKD